MAVLVLAFASPAFASHNDDFIEAGTLSGWSGIDGDWNTGASKEAGEPNHAGDPGGHSVWYRWTPASSGLAVLETNGSEFDTLLAVYTGRRVDRLTLVASDDDSAGSDAGTSRLTFQAQADTTYMIAVDGAGGATGRYSLSWNRPAPVNDNFPQGQAIAGESGTLTGTNRWASHEPGEPAHSPWGPNYSVWYRWIAPATGQYMFDTFGSDFDTALGIYRGDSVSSLTWVAVNDNWDFAVAPESRVLFRVTAGTAYRIAVDGGGFEDQGTFVLNWRPQPPPANDDFENAERIAGLSGSVRGTNFAATTQADPWHDPDEPPRASVWYRWTAPFNGRIALATTGQYSPYTALYRGDSLASLTRARTANDFGFEVERGIEYRVAVDSPLLGGDFVLEWDMLPPRNDAFSTPGGSQWSGGSVWSGTIEGTNGAATKDPGEPNHAGDPGGASVWFSWHSVPGTLRLSTTGSDFDTLLAVYTGSAVADLTRVAGDDDSGGNGTSTLTFHVDGTSVYRFAIDGAGGAMGDYVLGWSFVPAPPPNDDFADAQLISQERGFIRGRTSGATSEAGEPRHAASAAGKSAWYRWIAPKAGRATFDTFNIGDITVPYWYDTEFDSVLAVYRGSSLGTLTKVAAGNDYAWTHWSRASFTVQRGQEFYIAVDGVADAVIGSSGRLGLSWNIGPHNDDFGAPQTLTGVSGAVAGTTFDATWEDVDGGSSPGRWNDGPVWYRWEAPETGRFAVTLTGSGYWPYGPGIWTGSSVNTLQSVPSTTTFTGNSASAEFDAVSGTVYRVQVHSDYIGPFDLEWRPVAAADVAAAAFSSRREHDDFANRRLIGGREGWDQTTTFDATRQAGEPNHAGANGRHSVWYRYRAPAGGTVTFWTENVRFDTVVAAYTGASLEGLTLVAADNDSGDPSNGYGASKVSFPVVAGANYAIAVDGVGSARGSFLLRWRLPPPNDDMSNATSISGESGTAFGTSAGSGLEPGEPDTESARTRTIWYRWTAPATGTYAFDLAGTVPESGIEVFRGNALASLKVAGNWRYPARVGVDGGAEYLVRVASDQFGGNVTLNWQRLVEAPANDNFAAAEVWSGTSGAASGINFGSTREAGEPYHGGDGFTVWFRFTPPTLGKLHLSARGSTQDSDLVVYTGSSVTALTKLDEYGHYQTNCSPPAACYTTATIPVSPGTTYRIAYDGWGQGSYTVGWHLDSSSPDSGTSNDNFANAHVLTGTYESVWTSNASATKEPGEPNHAGNVGGKSIWYSWRAPAGGTTFFQTADCTPDTLLAVYRGTSVSALTHVASNDDYTANCGASSLSFNATAGSVYKVAVDGYNGAGGDIVLRWTAPDADTDAPYATIRDGPWGVVAERDARFDFYANETSATFQCSLDGASYSACASPIEYSGLAVGTHTLRVLPRDAAGNEPWWPATRTWRIAATPPNDDLAAAQPLAGAFGIVPGAITGATKEANEPEHGERPSDRSVWYRWTSPRSGIATMEAASATYFETLVDAYTGSSVGALTPVQEIAAWPDGRLLRRVVFRATAGTTYAVAVAGERNSEFRLTWRLAPVNDDRRNALPLVGADGQWTGTNIAATTERWELRHAGDPGGASVWLRWTAPATGSLSLDTVGSAASLDTLLGAYTEVPFLPTSELLERAADDDSPGAGKSRVHFDVFEGTTYFIAVDGFRGQQGSLTVNWQLDTAVSGPTPPTVTLTSPDDNSLVRDYVALGAEAHDADGIERVEFLVNGDVVYDDTSEPFVYFWDSNYTADGQVTIAARAFDFSSSSATSSVRTVTVDNTPPDTIITAGPSGTINSSRATFEFTATEADATFMCALDSVAWSPCTSPVQYTRLAAGPHVFRIRATDRAGNEELNEAWQSWYANVEDTTSPETTITAGPSGTVESTYASFNFTSSEPGSSFECSLDAGAYGGCTSPYQYQALSQGQHTFAVRAIDDAGNVDLTPASRTWNVAAPDTSAPETTITSGPAAFANSDAATFDLASSESGSSFECRWDGGEWTVCDPPIELTGLGEGVHSFAARAIDSAANVDATPATRSWTVDTLMPVVTAPTERFSTGAQLGSSAVPLRVAWSGSDATSGLDHYELEQSADGAWAAIPLTGALATSAVRSLAPAHTYQFRVSAVDRAGNESLATGRSFFLTAEQETGAGFSYVGTWTRQYVSTAYGRYLKYANVRGSRARCSFTGADGALVAPRGSNRGKAAIYVDGAYVKNIDLYSAKARPRQIVFARAWETAGPHWIELRLLGTKNSRSTGRRVDIDACVYLS